MPVFLQWMAWLVSAALILASPLAHAAEINAAATPGCQISLKGLIEPGDAAKLEAALAALRDESTNVTFCLDGPGGDYDEALRMIWMLLKRTNVATIVERGAQCFSACAFLFLAGNTQASEDGELAPDRTLDVRAALGFHAPYLEGGASAKAAEPTEASFRSGVNAIANMLEIDRRELFPRGLLAKALQVGPNYLLYIDTIEKAGVWSIRLKGYSAASTLTDTMLDQACRNKDMWTNFSHSFLGRPADDPEQSHGYRQSDFPEIRGTGKAVTLSGGKYRVALDLFGYEATNTCTIDVYHDPKRGLFLSAAMAPAEQSATDPGQFEQDVVSRLSDPYSMDLVTTPLWYVFAPDTKLKAIAAP